MLPIQVVLLAASALGAAVPSPAISSGPQDSACPILCIDGINDCGEGWGGCYPVCEPESSPTPHPCSKTGDAVEAFPHLVHAAQAEVTGSPGPSLVLNPGPSVSDNCSTRSVCADYINECGMMYGGCFADCKPWPTFTPPPCPSGEAESEPTPDHEDEGHKGE